MATDAGRVKHLNTTLVYPIDSIGDSFYPEAIKFTIYQRHGASLEQVQKSAGSLMKKMKTGLGLVPEKQLKEELEALSSQIKDLEAVTENKDQARIDGLRKEKVDKLALMDKNANLIDVAKQSGTDLGAIIGEATAGLNQVGFEKKGGRLVLKNEKTSQLGEIYLNMPNEVTFTDEANWEGTDLGAVGGMVKGEGKAAALSGAFSNFANIAGGGTGAITSMLVNLPGGAAGGAVLGMLGGTGLQKALESGTGNIANPYKEMTFSGIGFRNFSFNFVFRARNSSEVDTIQNIIETFRYYSKPIYSHGSSGFFSYPEEFHIEFLTKQDTQGKGEGNFKSNKYIPQIKMCVCKSVTTNFASQNAWRSLADGAPVEVSLALAFEETELVTGEDVIGETKIGRFKDSGGRF